MFAGLVFVGPHVNKVLLQVPDLDRLHGYPDLGRGEVMRMTLDGLEDLLGQLVHQVPPAGELEAQHPLHVLGGVLQRLGLLEVGPRLAEVNAAETKMLEAVNISGYDWIHGLHVNRSLPFDVDWILRWNIRLTAS